jgi:hypothetical protein
VPATVLGVVLSIGLTACGTSTPAAPAAVHSTMTPTTSQSAPPVSASVPASASSIDTATPESSAGSSSQPSTPAGLAASPPVSLSAPTIGIISSLINLGLNADGTIEVPSLEDPDSKAGWYRNSPAPGSLGPAIILGHVDSRKYGPGVFYSLKDLTAGDPIEITRADSMIVTFVVDSVQSVPKSEFPTLQVYGNLDHPGLRLITCGGEFDPDASSYESNIIVFATMVGSRPA